MAQYYDVHPENPQPRTLNQMVRILKEGRLIVYPADPCYALGCALGNGSGIKRIRRIRQLRDRHHFTLVVSGLPQLEAFVEMDSWVFRAIKAATPGPYTFILRTTREVPKMMQHLKRHTIDVRIPSHRTVLALLGTVGSPLASSILLLPDHPKPLVGGWTVKELLDHELDTVLGSGDCRSTPTIVMGLSNDEPEIVWVGTGDSGLFE